MSMFGHNGVALAHKLGAGGGGLIRWGTGNVGEEMCENEARGVGGFFFFFF